MAYDDVGRQGEALVEEIARRYGLEVMRHSNSGAVFGDSDMTIYTNPPTVASVKSTSKRNQTSIIIPKKDWDKAVRQARGEVPIFVNVGGDVMVTLTLEDFFYLVTKEKE